MMEPPLSDDFVVNTVVVPWQYGVSNACPVIGMGWQIFGGFTTTPWEVRADYYGTGESFLFKVSIFFY